MTGRPLRGLAVAGALSLLCYETVDFTLAGRSWHAPPRAVSATATSAVLDRSDALKTLGLEGSQFSSTFSDDELKKAYRQAVRRSHPDAPGGSAKKLQKVKDAYDYLMTAPSIKVWDEGKRQYGANSNPGTSGFPNADVGSSKPKPNAMRREVILGGIVGATLLSIAIASQVVSTDRRDEYLRSLEIEGDGALPDGLEPGKKLPPVVAQGKFLRGQEYIRSAEVALSSRCQVLLLGDLLPGGERMLGMGSPERALALTKLLGTVLAASSGDRRLYKSVTAVISQNDLNLVANNLRRLEDNGADIREPRSPYLMFGGGAVLRFQKDDPEQELLLLPSQRLFVASSDFDPLGPKTLAEMHKPNLVVFDLTKDQWMELRAQFAQLSGNDVPVSELQSEEMLQSLQAALTDEPAAPANAESP